MREANKVILEPLAQECIDSDFCPTCGLHKNGWHRRRDWNCCSKSCTSYYYIHLVIATSWQDMRIQVFDRDNKTCANCKNIFTYGELEADHIVPIALGGLQWDFNNIQTLCIKHHKIKTKQDMTDIRNFVSSEDKKTMLQEAVEHGEIRPN